MQYILFQINLKDYIIGINASSIKFTTADREYLELQTRAHTIQSQTVNHTIIILLRANGIAIDEIAYKVEMNRKNAMFYLKKFKNGGIENALFDAPERGRNAEITHDEKA